MRQRLVTVKLGDFLFGKSRDHASSVILLYGLIFVGDRSYTWLMHGYSIVKSKHLLRRYLDV